MMYQSGYMFKSSGIVETKKPFDCNTEKILLTERK